MKTVGDVIKIGRDAFYAGQIDRYLEAVQTVGFLIRDFANSDKIDLALDMEGYWYNNLVKLIESEQAYHDSFRWHYNALFNAGLRRRKNLPARDPRRICFVIPSGVLLGHTQVMLQIIGTWIRAGGSVQPCVVSLSDFDGKLDAALKSLGVKFFSPPRGLGGFGGLAEWCRHIIRREDCNTAIWVSVPVMVSYLFGFGLAPRQVFWSLKFHPVHLGGSVTHIAMTPPGDGDVVFHGRPWKKFSPPLSIPETTNQPEDIDRLRSSFGVEFIFGALARTEKFNSVEYVDAVVEIVKRCPGSLFVYTGREDSPLIRSRFSEVGLSDAIKFIGWVDTSLYSQVIDVFLETFPFGCGVTGAQAVNSGTRMVSLWRNETLPRYYFKSLGEAKALTASWQIETEIHEYKNRATEFFSQGRLVPTPFERDSLSALDHDKATRFRDLVIGP
jgi:hypothetical protein